jgi:hypothetical protein
MMDGHAGHGHGLARGGIFIEFLDGVGRPSGRSIADTRWPGLAGVGRFPNLPAARQTLPCARPRLLPTRITSKDAVRPNYRI